MFGSSSGDMPTPLSVIAMTAFWPRCSSVTSIRPPASVYFAAFVITFEIACTIRDRSPFTYSGTALPDVHHLVPLRAHERLHGLERERNRAAELHGLSLQLDTALRDAREVEQIVDELAELRDLPREQLADHSRRRVRRGVAHEQLARVLNRRERIAQLVAEHREELVLAPVFVAQRVARAHALGHVVAVHEDSGHGAGRIVHGLIHEIEVPALAAFVRPVLEEHRRRDAHVRLAAAIDLVEQLDEALRRHVRQRLAKALAEHVAAADELEVVRIRELEHVPRAAQDRDESGGLLEQRAPPRLRGLEALLREHLLGGFRAHHEHAADAVRRGRLVDRAVAVRPVDVLAFAVARDRHELVLVPRVAAARHHLLDLRPDDVPDLGPALAAGWPTALGCRSGPIERRYASL